MPCDNGILLIRQRDGSSGFLCITTADNNGINPFSYPFRHWVRKSDKVALRELLGEKCRSIFKMLLSCDMVKTILADYM